MRLLLACWLLAVATNAAGAAEETQPASEPAKVRPQPLKDPFFLILRDQNLRDQLALADTQRAGIDEVLRKHNHLLLSIRDVGPQGAPESLQPDIKQVREAVEKLLDDKQRARVEGLVLQAQGYDALLRPDMRTAFQLRPRQLLQLRSINDEFQKQATELNGASTKRTDEERISDLRAARLAQHKKVTAILNETQIRTWAARLGEPYEFAKLQSGPAWAPEFESIDTWCNSPPITMKSQHGRVVVVHFFAFNCINCIHNYPWYREWQDAYADKDVTIVGIHTPETQAENDVESLKKKLADNELRFPVAADNAKHMWKAWSNSIWPSVYIIDRDGQLRYWWYGELDWQGAGGQHLARKRIDQLLAEPLPK